MVSVEVHGATDKAKDEETPHESLIFRPTRNNEEPDRHLANRGVGLGIRSVIEGCHGPAEHSVPSNVIHQNFCTQ